MVELSRLTVTLLSLLVNCLAQDEPQLPKAYKDYDLMQAYKEQNMCPYLKVPGMRLPVLCWICGVPMKLMDSDKYEYDCCPGYEKSPLIENKCVMMESTWRPIIKYLREKGHVQTAAALAENTGIPDLDREPADKVYTVIVPSQDDDIKSPNIDYTRANDAAKMLVISGRHYSREFVNGATMQTMQNVPVKVTTYSNGLTFLDCKLLRSPDHETTNGLVHFVDGALDPTFKYPTLLKRLQAEPQLVDFVNDLPSDIRQKLDKANSAEWYTVFAPTNQAWADAKSKLGGRPAIEALARQHILPKMICAQAITQRSGTLGPTMADNHIGVTRRDNGKRAVIDSCGKEVDLEQEDLMSGTGVIHMIGTALVPIAGLEFKAAIACLGSKPENKVTRAAREMQDCNIDASTASSTIALIPDDSAFRWLESSQSPRDQSRRFRNDQNYRCNVYNYHIMSPNNGQSKNPAIPGMTQQVRMKTQYSAPNGQPTYVTNQYIRKRDGSKLFFNQAPARSLKPIPFKGGKIYIVERINFPPQNTMTEIIANQPNMKKITDKIRSTGMDREFSKLSPKVVFLSPIDMGWQTRDLENGYSNAQTHKLLQLHTIPHALFGGDNGFTLRESKQQVESLLPDNRGGRVKLILKRNLDGNMLIGHKDLEENLWAMVLDWNQVGTDGVVWFVDWPIKCPSGLC